MSMSFGGDPYAALIQALMQRRQAAEQRQPMQPMPQMGGTMQMQPANFSAMSGGQSPMASAMGNMPSASSMAEMLKRFAGGWGGGGDDKSFHFANTARGGSSGMDV